MNEEGKIRSAVVTGAASGLGAAVANRLRDEDVHVIPYDLNGVPSQDVTDPTRVLPEWVEENGLDVLVNCAGVNHQDWLEDLKPEDWDRVMDVNAMGIYRMTQMLLPHLRQANGTVCNVVSNASHVPMRCSAAYNASKGAAAILSKQMARELAPDVTVFAVSPNKLEGTGMSEDIDRQVQRTRGWSAEEARRYQLAGLLTGKETPVEHVAEFMAWLLVKPYRNKHLAGCDIPYGA